MNKSLILVIILMFTSVLLICATHESFEGSDSIISFSPKAIMTESNNMQLLFTYNTDISRALDVKIIDTFALLCDNYNGVRLFSIANPSLPKLLGTCDTPGRALRMQIHDGLISVADGEGGISVLSFRDIENPELYCTYPSYSGGVTWGIFTQNPSDESKALPNPIDTTETLHKQPFIFTASGTDGLLIFNVTNFSPMLMSQALSGSEGVPGIWVDKDVAYVLKSNHLTILDVSNKNNPVFLKEFYISDANHDLYLYEDYLYVCAGHGDMLIYDVKDRKNPVQVGRFDAAGPSIDVYVTGNRAFLASNEGGVSVLDVTDKKNPSEIAYYRSPGYFDTRGIFAVGEYVYVGAQYTGFFVLKYTEPAIKPDPRDSEMQANDFSKISKNSFTNICFENEKEEVAVLMVYDLNGRVSYVNNNLIVKKGFNAIRIDDPEIKQGTYFWLIKKESGFEKGKFFNFEK